MIDVDYRNCPDCTPSELSLTEATFRTAPMVGDFHDIRSDVPKNRRICIHFGENASYLACGGGSCDPRKPAFEQARHVAES